MLKTKLVNLLLSDVEIEELVVKKIKAGKKTIKITPDFIDMAVLTADPSLAVGRMWMLDIGELRFTEDGATVRTAGLLTHDRAYHVSPTLPTDDAHVTAVPIDHPDDSVPFVKAHDLMKTMFIDIFRYGDDALRDLLYDFVYAGAGFKMFGYPNVKAIPTPDAEIIPAGGSYDINLLRLRMYVPAGGWLQLNWDLPTYDELLIIWIMNHEYYDQRTFLFDTVTGDRYLQIIDVTLPTADHSLRKVVAGVSTVLATESVDLAYNTDIHFAWYYNKTNGTHKIWRDGALAIDVVDTQVVPNQFRFVGNNKDTVAHYYYFKYPLFLMYR